MTNTKELNKRIKKSGLKKSYIAITLGIAVSTLSRKISGKLDFKASEIDTLCNLLGIESLEEKEAIFFASEVAVSATA